MKSFEDYTSKKYFIFFVALASCLFLYLTKNHMPFFESIDSVDANDVYSYIKMPMAFPGFSSERISYHFAQRFIPHYLVGALASWLHVGVEISYGLLNGFIVFLILFFSLKVICKKIPDKRQALLWYSILAFSPFSLRLNVFVPGLLADLVFILGLAISLEAILSKSLLRLELGMLLATSGKQMALLVLPGILFYSFLVFREIHGSKKTFSFCAFLAFSVMVFNKSLAWASASFANPNSLTSKLLLSVIPWIFSDKFSLSLMVEHLTRIFLPSLPFLILIFMLGDKRSVRRLWALENLALLLIVLGPAAYAFLPGPIVQVGNQSRYIAAVLLPILLFSANVLPSFMIEWQKEDLAVLIGILFLFTYHHRYCLLPSNSQTFLALHFASLGGLVLWLWRRRGKVFIPRNQ